MSLRAMIAACAFALAATSAHAGYVFKGNDTGGIISWNPEVSLIYKEIAAAHCSRYNKVAFITSIPHTSKIGWFRTKLHDPRVLDKGRVLRQDEKLRMPNFDFTDKPEPPGPTFTDRPPSEN